MPPPTEPNTAAILLLSVQAVLAWVVSRREPGHRAVAVGASALVGMAVVLLVARLGGWDVSRLETATVVVAGLGLWIVARSVMEGANQARWALGLAAVACALVVGAMHPAVDAVAREWIGDGASVIGVFGAWWSIQRALVRQPRVEPRLAHLVVLLHAALGAVWLTVTEEVGWAGVPALAAAGAAAVAQGTWLTKIRREGTHVGDGAEQLRPHERVGDLVALAGTVRGRAARGPGSSGSIGEP